MCYLERVNIGFIESDKHTESHQLILHIWNFLLWASFLQTFHSVPLNWSPAWNNIHGTRVVQLVNQCLPQPQAGSSVFYYYFEHDNIKFRGLWMFGKIVMTKTLHHPDPWYIVGLMLPNCLFVIKYSQSDNFYYILTKRNERGLFFLWTFYNSDCSMKTIVFQSSSHISSHIFEDQCHPCDLICPHTPIQSGMFIVCMLRRSAAPNTKVTQLFLCW